MKKWGVSQQILTGLPLNGLDGHEVREQEIGSHLHS